MHAGTQNHSHSARARHHGHGGIEYGVYFTLVFLISLPTALIRMIIPRRGQRAKFFVTEAWAMAQMVTPRIFSA